MIGHYERILGKDKKKKDGAGMDRHPSEQ